MWTNWVRITICILNICTNAISKLPHESSKTHLL